jgi:capsid portal protein
MSLNLGRSFICAKQTCTRRCTACRSGSALLNESATLFRRKYYENGSHAGFILYMTDAAQNEADVDSLRKALKDSKGPGNFRNLFVYSPNGKKDGCRSFR